MTPTDEDISLIVWHPGLRHLRTVAESASTALNGRVHYEVSIVLDERVTMTINGDFAYVMTTAAQLIRDKEGQR